MDATATAVALSEIDWDASQEKCQMRGHTQSDVVAEYADAYRAGAELPPVTCFTDGKSIWLVDGFHRAEAATDAGLEELPVVMHTGELRDAILTAVGANSSHGLRRTNEDKRRAVATLLGDSSWKKWGDAKIAKLCGVSAPMVGGMRKSISKSFRDGPRLVERNGKTYEMDTANIGKQSSQPEETDDDEPTEDSFDGGHNGTPADVLGAEDEVEAEAPEARRPHVSNNSGENEWYTPEAIINSVTRVMGEIGLDPASSDKAQETVRANKYYTAKQNGLKKSWKCESLWLNPPYAQPLMSEFIAKLCEELLAKKITQACVLVNNATETQWFQRMASLSSAVCFLRGRVKFNDITGKPVNTPLQGQVLLYFGDDSTQFAREFEPLGLVMEAHDYD